MTKPSSFLWGAATSSHQVEGNNFHNDWWHWEQKGKVETGEISGRATDHWNRYKEDLALAASLGLNSYRFSIEWSRCEPKEGQWDFAAIEWYQDLVNECERLGIVPMATLHHFTSPQWFAEEGGFLNENSPLKFGRFVNQVIDAIGPRVPLWCTLNEPMVLAVGQYLGGFMPPAEFNPANVGIATRNMFRSHIVAYDALHTRIRKRQGPWRYDPLMVGIAHNMVDFLPDRSWHLLERYLARTCRLFFNQAWLDAISGADQHFGVPVIIPDPKPVEEGLGRRTADFIGINYYTKAYLHWLQEKEDSPMPFRVDFFREGEKRSDLDWAIHPSGLGRMIRFVKRYGLPIYITENGIADATDKQRSHYLVQHLSEVAKEIKGGADVRGYYHWSLLDNFEWIKGYPPRFGLIEVNYDTFERVVRGSAKLYGEIIRHHQEYYSLPELSLLSDFSLKLSNR